MYEKLDNCPSCHHPKFDNHLICKDHAVSQESFALVKCGQCNIIFTNPRPSKYEFNKYYESEEYIPHTNRGNSLLHIAYKLARYFTLRKKRKLINKYIKSGTILDYGCGTGDFLKVCQDSGYNIKGVEPNEKAREQSNKKLNQSVFSDIYQVDKKEKFQAITAWHVMEHVTNLKETLKQLRKKLAKGGFLFIAVPNINSLDAKFYKEYWAAYDIPRHLYHFSQSSFKTLAKKAKLQHVNTVPMKLDAYYVSLLSEKYLNGRPKIIKAILKGNESNREAAKTGEYSSLIYVLNK